MDISTDLRSVEVLDPSSSDSVDGVLSPEPLPLTNSLKFTCANCSLTLTASLFVSDIRLPDSEKFSISEGIRLLFNSRPLPSDQDLKLCLPCGESLQKILREYTIFRQNSVSGSYIHNLINNIPQKMKQESSEEHKAYDLSDFCYEPMIEITTGSFTGSGLCIDQSRPIRRSPRKRKIQKKTMKSKKKVKSRPLSPVTGNDEDGEDSRWPEDIQSDETGTCRSPKKRKVTNRKRSQFSKISTSPAANQQRHDCKTCGAEFATVTWLRMHEAGHTNQRPFSCDECRLSFKTREHLRIHLCRHHPDHPRRKQTELSGVDKDLLTTTEYRCDACVKVSLPNLKEWVLHHQHSHGLDMGYGNLDVQESLKPKNGLFRPCPRCGKKIKSNMHALQHIKNVHMDERPVICDLCPKRFATEHARQIHHTNVHSSSPPQFLCTLCGSAFKTKNILETHEKTHFGLLEKKFECDICHSKHSSNYQLKNHKALKHSDERPFACDQCGGTYKLLVQLNQHKRKFHEKKFIIDEFCEFCGKGYAFKEKLKEHLMSTHKLSKEDARLSARMKPPGIFRVLPNGDRIMAEKPTKPKTCGFCGRTYARREQLFTHLISVHAQTPEAATEITGLRTSRNLLPGGNSKRTTATLCPTDDLSYTYI